MISAGRVLIIPRGDYEPSTQYDPLDLVSYNGSSYIAKKSTTGNLPTNTTYWQLNAYGGSASNMAANFAPLETTEYATQPYSVGQHLVDKDGQYRKVTVGIATGDEINNTNTEITSIEEVIEDFFDYVNTLDEEDAKLTGKTAITTQTDLHTLGVGNYFKANTSVYVTNAPTGIDSVPTATFRLTVENINNASGDTTKILTLRTFDGKTYTQAYDGTTWSDWKTPGTAAYKDSTNAVTSGSTDLVESGAVASELDTVNSSITTLTNKKLDNNTSLGSTIYTDFNALPNVAGLYILQGATVLNAPYSESSAYYWECIQMGQEARKVQITTNAFIGYKGSNELWMRTKHDNTWSSWRRCLSTNDIGGNLILEATSNETWLSFLSRIYQEIAYYPPYKRSELVFVYVNTTSGNATYYQMTNFNALGVAFNRAGKGIGLFESVAYDVNSSTVEKQVAGINQDGTVSLSTSNVTNLTINDSAHTAYLVG